MVSFILVIISASFSQAQVTPSVSISSNATNNSLCRGTAVTFTATPTNGGATPTYQWRKNGVNVGTGATLTLNNIVDNDLIRVVMTTSLSAAEVTSSTATSNAITTTVNNLPSVVSTTSAPINSCVSSGTATLTAVPSSGSVIDWYASTSSTTPLLTSSNSYTTPNISATTTYYAVARDVTTGCQSNGTTSQSMAINWGPNNAYIQTTKPVTGSFTIEFWLNTTGLSSAGCSSWRCGEGIVSANTSGSNNDFGITMYNNYVAFGLGNPDVSIVSTSYMNSLGWKHVAASWDSTTGAMKLYVNGVLEGSATGGTASRDGQTALRLGALLNAPVSGAYGFSRGSLDEVRIWSKAKTQSEILANMNNNVNGQEANLAEYFNFNQGIFQGDNSGVTRLYDLSLNGYNGTLNGFTGLVRGVQGNYITGYGLNAAQYPVTATKIDIPTVTSSTSGAIVCGGNSTTVSATASAGAKIDWYADASGGTALATGVGTFTTPTLSATTTYYAEARDTIAGCISTSRTAVTATVSAVISGGITNNTGSTVLTCARTAISVTATGGTSYSWSNSLGSSANASITAAGTYTVTVTGANGCTATSSITVSSDISTPTIGITNNTGSTVLTCARTAISVTTTGGSSYSWSNSLGSSATASITTAGTYTVTATGANGCTATSSITITQDIASPAAPSGTGGAVCSTGTVMISATPGAGETIDWYAASSGGSVLSSGSGVTSFTTPSISTTTTYYAEARNTTTACVSASRTAVTATVDVQSVAAAGADQSLCNTSIFTMAAVPTAGTGVWTIISGSASITSSASATTSITAVPSNSSVTLRWTETNGTCSSSTDEVIIRNNALATISNAGADQSLCNTAQFTLAGNNPSLGTGAWSLIGSSGSASITNSSLRTSTITSVPENTGGITLRWTITNVSCVSTDEVIIRNNPLPDVTISTSGATTIAYGNSVTLAAPAVGNALTFNGSSNYVSIPSNINSAITGNNITIEGWFYITSTFNLTGLVTEALGSNNNVKFGITSGVVSGAQKIYAGFTNASLSTTVTSTTNLPLNTWTHIAATYDGTSLNVYVNGTLTGTLANSNGLPSGADEWYFGKAASGNNLFPGTMDEIRIWNVAKSQSDINANKNSTIATNSNGLVGYYKLDENSGSTAADATGNGYMGTVN
jgi:hypothetical protein